MPRSLHMDKQRAAKRSQCRSDVTELLLLAFVASRLSFPKSTDHIPCFEHGQGADRSVPQRGLIPRIAEELFVQLNNQLPQEPAVGEFTVHVRAQSLSKSSCPFSQHLMPSILIGST